MHPWDSERKRSPRDAVVYALKWTVAQTLYALGLLSLWKRVLLKDRVVVLAYHRVLGDGSVPESWSHPAIIVSLKTFERQMSLLRRHFDVLSPAEFEARLQTGASPKRASCVVTFDDGWYDTYRDAWPVLRRLDIPAIVFLPVRFIGSNETFWQEQLGFLLFEACKRSRVDSAFARRARPVVVAYGLGEMLEQSTDRARGRILDRVRQLKTDAQFDPVACMQALRKLLGQGPPLLPQDRFITWEEAREMAAAGIAFGGHGTHHLQMTRFSESDLSNDVRTCRATIERELACSPTAFSYPNGDWDVRVADEVRRAGFRVAFSMQRGTVSSRDDHFSLRRVNIHEDVTSSRALFLARLLGVF